MDTATETVLAEVKKVRNIGAGGELSQKAVRYLTWNERQARHDELDGLNKLTSQPLYVQGAITSEGRQALAKRKRQIEKSLADGAPPELTGGMKDALHSREVELESKLKTGMLTTEDMRRNPPGAVDRHRRWERSNKDEILEWKNIRRALSSDSDDKDLSNIELLRSSSLRPDGASTFIADAQIPGKFAQTPLAKANWPLGEPKVNTPLKQAAKREATEKQLAALTRARETKTARKVARAAEVAALVASVPSS